MNTHLFILIALGFASTFAALKFKKLKVLSIKREFWTLIFGLIIISILGLVSVYALLLPAKDFQAIFDQSLFGIALIFGLFVIIWALPFFVNYKEAAPVFTTSILLVSFSLGAIYFAHDYVPLIVISVTFSVGALTNVMGKDGYPKN